MSKLKSILIVVIATAALAGGFFVFLESTDQYTFNFSLPFEKTSTSTLEYGERIELSHADFFQKSKKKLIDAKADFIEADLTAMTLKVYLAGVVQKEAPILTKGKEGSWWQTPAGFYKVESKEKKHFSSFGKVYTPWNLVFQGNFFIHGWPYYPDGTPVSSQYSGGCIRLGDEDAEAVYKMVKAGMPILVYEQKFDSDNFKYQGQEAKITAQNYLVADLKNNHVFLEKDSKVQVPIASITKLVNALVVVEYLDLDKVVTVKKSMIASTSKPRLYVGQKVTAYNLLYPLLIESSNEAAEALAQTLGSQRFVSLMNKKHDSLGLARTSFVDVTGEGLGNVSTAEDLFGLSKYIYLNRSFIFKLSTGTLKTNAYDGGVFTDLSNSNLYQDDPAFVGGQTGIVQDKGETMVAVFDLNFGGQKRPINIILLGSTNLKEDVDTILMYLKARYQ